LTLDSEREGDYLHGVVILVVLAGLDWLAGVIGLAEGLSQRSADTTTPLRHLTFDPRLTHLVEYLHTRAFPLQLCDDLLPFHIRRFIQVRSL
jgi:hypothetical protein